MSMFLETGEEKFYGYVPDGNGGLDLVHDGETVLSIPADGHLGFSFEIDDAIGGTLHKHGPFESAEKHHVTMVAVVGLAGLPTERFFIVKLPVKGMALAVIDEVNDCLAASGRVRKLLSNLVEMAKTIEGEAA